MAVSLVWQGTLQLPLASANNCHTCHRTLVAYFGYSSSIYSRLALNLVCPVGSTVSPSLHHQGQAEQIGPVFTWAPVHILYNTYSILLVFVYIYLFSLFCIFEKNKLKMWKTWTFIC